MCSLLVDPVEEEGLVGLEIGVLNEQDPKMLNLLNA